MASVWISKLGYWQRCDVVEGQGWVVEVNALVWPSLALDLDDWPGRVNHNAAVTVGGQWRHDSGRRFAFARDSLQSLGYGQNPVAGFAQQRGGSLGILLLALVSGENRDGCGDGDARAVLCWTFLSTLILNFRIENHISGGIVGSPNADTGRAGNLFIVRAVLSHGTHLRRDLLSAQMPA